MIKNLKSKLIICLFLLVTVFSVTSSCFAFSNVLISNIESSPYTLEEINQLLIDNGYSDWLNYKKLVYGYGPSSFYIFVFDNENISYLAEPSTSANYVQFYDSSGAMLMSNCVYLALFNGNVDKSFISSNRNNVYFSTYDNSTIYYSNYDIYDISGNLFYTASALPIDTSFNYSFDGVERGRCKLTIDGLDSSLKMYGYVDCENSFNIGDVLDTSSISDYLRLLATTTDNSDLYCYLYENEKLLYYIVDDENIILDIGYISEMAEGYFLYGFNVYNGVDFVFLKDGQVYWDNNLTFKYSTGSSQIEKNVIVSMGSSSYITSDKTVASKEYIGYVYDSSGTLISQASTTITNDLSSISMVNVTTSYYENNVGWNKSCYWLMSFTLSGTNKDGSSIDFSNYYVRWSIPTWLELDSIKVNSEEYTKRNGIFSGFSSSGYSGMVNLQIFELIKNHTSDFDITLEVYDSDDNLVLTYVVNSDDIVNNQVLSEENNVDKEDYDILDNPNYTGGSNNSGSSDINNIQNWTSDDYVKLMSTDNFVWEFFRAILGNLPWWITTPLTILIFGVVVITLIRFARGA